jgi:monoamine oxidase
MTPAAGLDADVAVVGGGVSGLAAARWLVEAGIDRVVVLDARLEPGGMCVQREAGGVLLDCGAGWTAASQHRIKALAAAYGIGTYRIEVPGGESCRLVDGRIECREPGVTALGARSQAELDEALAQLDRLCARVPPGRPWDAESADELDEVTVERWICAQSEDVEVRAALAELFVSTLTSTRQLSLLSALAFLASCGGVAGLETEADEQFVGGAGQIPRRIAEQLGARVRLGWPALELARTPEGVRVSGPEGVVLARRAIVAMSPADAGRIAFRPGLPTQRDLLHKGWLASSVVKTNVVYDAPFWHRPRGEWPAVAGWSVNDAGCPSVVLDATPADGSVGVLAAFTLLQGEGQRWGVAAEVLDDPARRGALLLDRLGRMFGPEALLPRAVQETHWTQEPWAGGCLSFGPPGLLTHSGAALREPVGPVHWAGATAADTWINHLDGAVQAGERAAGEVAAALAASR